MNPSSLLARVFGVSVRPTNSGLRTRTFSRPSEDQRTRLACETDMRIADQGRSAQAEPTLRLAGLTPFGVGGRRLCFVHPGDLHKCVKVPRQDDRRTIRMNRRTLIPARFRRFYDNNANEMRALNHLFRKIGPGAARHLPRSYGMFPTDLGPGLVLDLVRDADGRISRSLRELLSTGFAVDEFREAFDELGEFLLTHHVLTRALLDHNIVAEHRADGRWRLYLIDGLGDRAWLPIAEWIRSLGQAKVRRRLNEAWRRFEKLWRQGGVPRQLIESSSWGQGFLNHRGE